MRVEQTFHELLFFSYRGYRNLDNKKMLESDLSTRFKKIKKFFKQIRRVFRMEVKKIL